MAANSKRASGRYMNVTLTAATIFTFDDGTSVLLPVGFTQIEAHDGLISYDDANVTSLTFTNLRVNK